jgi:hypothetical protein
MHLCMYRSPSIESLVPGHGGKELLKISDEEMLNFPSKLTEAFNIGDYEGVSKVNVYMNI